MAPDPAQAQCNTSVTGVQQADGTALPFQDAAFDTVICQYGVMFYPDKAKGYAEAHRVLAPSGHYLFSVWDEHRHNGATRIAHEVIASSFPATRPDSI